MSARLRIDFDPGEGTLSRLLGLIERRGFRVDALEMPPVGQGHGAAASLRLDITARDAGRRIEMLDLQLRRVHGIRDVTITAPANAVAVAVAVAPSGLARITP